MTSVLNRCSVAIARARPAPKLAGGVIDAPARYCGPAQARLAPLRRRVLFTRVPVSAALSACFHKQRSAAERVLVFVLATLSFFLCRSTMLRYLSLFSLCLSPIRTSALSVCAWLSSSSSSSSSLAALSVLFSARSVQCTSGVQLNMTANHYSDARQCFLLLSCPAFRCLCSLLFLRRPPPAAHRPPPAARVLAAALPRAFLLVRPSTLVAGTASSPRPHSADGVDAVVCGGVARLGLSAAKLALGHLLDRRQRARARDAHVTTRTQSTRAHTGHGARTHIAGRPSADLAAARRRHRRQDSRPRRDRASRPLHRRTSQGQGTPCLHAGTRCSGRSRTVPKKRRRADQGSLRGRERCYA